MPNHPIDTQSEQHQGNNKRPRITVLEEKARVSFTRQWLSSPRWKQFAPLLWSLPAFLIAVIGGLLLFAGSIFTNLVTIIINIGLDPLRSQLVIALVMTATAALIGAMVGRRKLAALAGAWIVFLVDYLFGFISLELQPLRDPGGLLEPLNGSALVHTSLIMIALGIASAFIGMAIGSSLGEILLAPLYQLVAYAWKKRTPHMTVQNGPSRLSIEKMTTQKLPDLKKSAFVISKWAGIIATIVVLFLLAGSTDLFIFSPDVGLHSVPVVSSGSMPPHGTVVEGSLISPALGGQRKLFEIYLPPTYNTPQGQNKYYPALYLLHGSPGKDIDWITGGKAVESADTLIATHKIPEMIMVFPDGNGRPKQTSEWGNSGDHKQLMETYVANDLVKYIDRHYRTLPDPGNRGIGGLSMGGFGATNIAIHHPDIFGLVISLGGYYRPEGAIWGKDPSYLRLNSPLAMLPTTKAAWKLRYYLGAATKDQPYYTDARQFAQELDKLHIPYRFDLEKGYHSWRIWQVQLYKAMTWLQWDATTNHNKLKGA